MKKNYEKKLFTLEQWDDTFEQHNITDSILLKFWDEKRFRLEE